MTSQPKEATAYLQVSRHPSRPWGPESRVVKSTQKRPEIVEPGCIVVKVRLRIPAEAWEPFQPEAIIDVPAELVRHPIDVTAEDADT